MVEMFIVLEGIDGCGKTTQARRLAGWLGDRLGADNVVVTREPGGWPGGERIRGLILDGGLSSRWGEFFAFMADRCEHVARVISPALCAGKCVLCDRYAASTLAYQVFSGPEAPETAAYLAGLHRAIDLPAPDCSVLLDIAPAAAAARTKARGAADSFDARREDFFARVRDGYEKIMSESPDCWVRIDGSLPEDEVFRELTGRLEARFPSRLGGVAA
jgi:dTMP kinase